MLKPTNHFLGIFRFTILNLSYFLLKGFLELALQEHYTALPDSGQTHMTIYNGLPPSCAINLPPIQLNYIPTDQGNLSRGIDNKPVRRLETSICLHIFFS